MQQTESPWNRKASSSRGFGPGIPSAERSILEAQRTPFLETDMIAPAYFALALIATHAPTGPAVSDPEKLARTYVDAVEKLNATHAAKPGRTTESELVAKLPKKASQALEKLLKSKGDQELESALADCARAALDIDHIEDFDRARRALAELSQTKAEELGVAASSGRVLVIAEGGLKEEYATHFARVCEDVLAAYDELFGFEEFSKVPGKKLRLRVHLEEEITRPPHFAPQFPYHSEIDFPVIDAERLRSPTAKGQFLFYGLCHEIGHVVAMWGDHRNEEDHHAWAHYTGVTIVEHLAQSADPPEWLANCKDVRWRSLSKERERLAEVEPGTKDRDGVLALFFALHDLVGPGGLGRAINELDREDKRLRRNRVRYYSFRELAKALAKGEKDKQKRKALDDLFD